MKIKPSRKFSNLQELYRKQFQCPDDHAIPISKNRDTLNHRAVVDLGFGFGLLLYVPVNSCGHVGTVSSSNHTFFLCKLEQAVNQYFVHILSPVTCKPFLKEWIISWSISTKVWDRVGIKLTIPGSAVRHSEVRHVTNCAVVDTLSHQMHFHDETDDKKTVLEYKKLHL